MPTPQPFPTEIHAPINSKQMKVFWSDGHRGEYTHDALRGFCPCATCQGHQGPIRYVEGGNLELEEIREVGNYAIRLCWADGHATGIYSFSYLRQLCVCGQCGPLDGREIKR